MTGSLVGVLFSRWQPSPTSSASSGLGSEVSCLLSFALTLKLKNDARNDLRDNVSGQRSPLNSHIQSLTVGQLGAKTPSSVHRNEL